MITIRSLMNGVAGMGLFIWAIFIVCINGFIMTSSFKYQAWQISNIKLRLPLNSTEKDVSHSKVRFAQEEPFVYCKTRIRSTY